MTNAVLDLGMINDLEEMVAVDELFISNYLSCYFEKAEKLYEEAKEAFGANNKQKAITTLSDLRSTSLTSGARELAKETEDFENIVKGNDDVDHATHLDVLSRTFQKTRDEAKRLGFL